MGAISIFVFGYLSSNTCKFKPARPRQTITLMLFTLDANEEYINKYVNNEREFPRLETFQTMQIAPRLAGN